MGSSSTPSHLYGNQDYLWPGGGGGGWGHLAQVQVSPFMSLQVLAANENFRRGI